MKMMLMVQRQRILKSVGGRLLQWRQNYRVRHMVDLAQRHQSPTRRGGDPPGTTQEAPRGIAGKSGSREVDQDLEQELAETKAGLTHPVAPLRVRRIPTSPFPPLSPGRIIKPVVTCALTIARTLDSFDAASFKQSLALALGVSATTIALTVVAGSIRVTVEIVLAEPSSSTRVVEVPM